LAECGHPSKVNLKAERSYIEKTFDRLPLAVNLAIKHIMDYRAQGLDELGVRYFGWGRRRITSSIRCCSPAAIKHRLS